MNGSFLFPRARRSAARSFLIAATLVGAMALPAVAGETLATIVPASTPSTSIVDGITNADGRGDRLAVTVARIAGHNGVVRPAHDMDIWVGEVEVQGRKTVWVELIDKYGEVIYDAEVDKNETHLLPDGRAIVVRALPDNTLVAKADDSRIATDANLVVTRRVVEDENRAATVEFLQEDRATESESDSPLVAVGQFGERIWAQITALFSAAASNVRLALAWIYDAVTV